MAYACTRSLIIALMQDYTYEAYFFLMNKDS